jgi:tetratricopeptide (TPR) repeat protein
MALKTAENYKNENELLRAASTLKGFQYPLFLRSFMSKAERGYARAYLVQLAANARAEGDYDKAIKLYKKAREKADVEDPTIEGGIKLAQYERHATEAAALGLRGRWDEAIGKWRQAVEHARAFELLKEKRAAERSLELARLISSALRAEADGRHESARDYWLRAKRINPDHPVVKKNLLRIGIEP